MNLRELINRLEELSENGINDKLDVEIEDLSGTRFGVIDANIKKELCESEWYKLINIEIL